MWLAGSTTALTLLRQRPVKQPKMTQTFSVSINTPCLLGEDLEI